MPIGTADYVSTAAWNDAFNPWPQYAQLTLSAAEVSLITLTLVSFNPVASMGFIASVTSHYEDNNSSYRLDYDATGNAYGNGISWNVWDNNNEDVLYFKETLIRALPAKAVGVADEWVAGGSGSDPSTLYIQPVTTHLTPWEYRRRRTLEYV